MCWNKIKIQFIKWFRRDIVFDKHGNAHDKKTGKFIKL